MPSRLFFSAAILKPYDSFLFFDKSHQNIKLELNDKRVYSAAQCQSPHSSQWIVARGGGDKILLIDAYNCVVREISDLSSHRKGVGLGQERMALGMPSESLVYVVWRTGGNHLRLNTISLDGGQSSSIDIGNIWRDLAQ
jgi:hypothetical protein